MKYVIKFIRDIMVKRCLHFREYEDLFHKPEIWGFPLPGISHEAYGCFTECRQHVLSSNIEYLKKKKREESSSFLMIQQ